MVCTLGSKPQGPCERRGQRRRPTSRYWFPAIGRQTAAGRLHTINWREPDPVAHAHSLSCHLHLCFPAYDRPLPCHQTSPGQQPLRPFPSLALASGSEIGKGFVRTPRPVVLAIYSSPSPLPHTIINNTRSRRIRNTICDEISPTQPLRRGERKNIPRPLLHASRRAIPGFPHMHRYLISSSPTITTYH
jgi:hypothetical protein